MAGLQRFITYINKYENDEKMENAGFAKVEIRGSVCRVEVHLRNLAIEQTEATVYLFARKEEIIQGIPVGEMVIARGAGDVRYAFEVKELLKFGLTIGDMEGIMIPVGGQDYLASQWKNGEIKINSFQVLKEEAESKRLDTPDSSNESVPSKTAGKERASVRNQAANRGRASVQTNSGNDKDASEQVNSGDDKGAPVQNHSGKASGAPIQANAKSVSVSTDSGNRESAPMQLESDSGTDASVQTNPANVKDASVQSAAAEKKGVSVQQQTADVRDGSSQRDNRNIQATELPLEEFLEESGWEKIFQKLRLKMDIVYPFEGQEIECVNMQLNDLQEFPRKYWYVGNNSFLLHGFFNYRHILFGEMSENGKKEYFIGVPGIFQNQERVMASMFGFPEFRTAKHTEFKTGNFGYWYRIL